MPTFQISETQTDKLSAAIDRATTRITVSLTSCFIGLYIVLTSIVIILL